jgi:hypothetical protein
MMLSKSSFAFFAFLYICKHIIGCAANAPNRSSPRGYNRKLVLSISSNKSSLLWSSDNSLFDNIVGCTASAPDESSPRGYSRISSGIDSRNEFFFLDASVSFITIFRRLPWSSSNTQNIIPDFLLNFSLLVSTIVAFFFSRYSNSHDIINRITLYVIWLGADRCLWAAQ